MKPYDTGKRLKFDIKNSKKELRRLQKQMSKIMMRIIFDVDN